MAIDLMKYSTGRWKLSESEFYRLVKANDNTFFLGLFTTVTFSTGTPFHSFHTDL